MLLSKRLGPTRERWLFCKEREQNVRHLTGQKMFYLVKNVFILSYGGDSFPAKVSQESQSGSVFGRVRWDSAVQQWKLVFVRQIRGHGRVRNLRETKKDWKLRFEIVIMSVQKKFSDSIGRFQSILLA